MRALILILAAALATPALAQPASSPPPPTKLFASKADIDALVAQSKAERAAGVPAGGGKSVIALAPYNAGLEYRTTITAAAVHEKEAELFYVLDGSGVLMTGGKLTAETRVNAENLSGTGIEGGKTQAVAKGDMVIVPENTPHWFSTINGTLVMISLHVPRGR
ncbi:MAG: hypothetical protein ABIO39_11825 [Caulobacteraceae bacterium]